jgi:ferredoxin-thioredoxin reductase catalytic subunit
MDETKQETPISEITSRLEAFAAQRGYGFSRAKDKIIRELVYIHQQVGDFYCPCQEERDPTTVCVCLEVQGGYVDVMGKCHCNLFVKPAA